MFGRPPPPRRALVAATLGAIFGVLVLPAPGTVLGVTAYGVTWFVLSVALLFLHPWAYHGFVFWGILFVVWRGIVHARTTGEAGPLAVGLDLGVPLVALALLFTSGYMQAVQDATSEA